MRILIAALAGLLALGLAGCVVHAYGPHHHRVVYGGPRGRGVVVEHAHVCTIHCRHCWHDGHWYECDHVHGPGCGHHVWGGRWYAIEEVEVEHVHVHDAHCGHYWHGGRWFFVGAHVHGPGCGHVHVEGRWMLVVR